MKRYTFLFLSLLVALSMVLGACQPATETPVVEEPTEVEETEVVEETEEPTEEPEVSLEDLVAQAEESAAAAAASAEAAAAAAAGVPDDAAAVADLVAAYEPVPYPEVGDIDDIAELVEPEGDLVSFPESDVTTTRTGAWPDEVTIVNEEDGDLAINRLLVGNIDVYAYTVSDPEQIGRIEAAEEIDYYFSSGSYNELTLNTAGPEFNDGRLNPFSSPVIREAMNMLVDRQYLVDELLAGAGTPRWTALNSASADAAEVAGVIRAMEVKYAYDKDAANEIISAEMEALGAEMADGVWQYNGEPVVIKMLIRTEDERQEIGDYVANQLEDIGFTTERDYKVSADASPIWVSTDPFEGAFSIYTGGWITTAIPRSLGDNFAFFNTPMGYGVPLWQAYENDPRFYELAEKLAYGEYETMAERKAMMEEIIPLSLKESQRIWLYDAGSFTPKVLDVKVSSDLYGAVAGSYVWAQSIHRVDEDGDPIEGGGITVAMPGLLTEPWNPIAGTNWIYDMMPVRGTGDHGFKYDPFTGLLWPQRAESADLYIQAGVPMKHTLDWLDLYVVGAAEEAAEGEEAEEVAADKIIVPGDAWADWDAEAQTFLTVEEYYNKLITELPANAEADVATAETGAADAATAADAAAAAAEEAAAATDADAAQAAADAAAEAAAEAADAEAAATGAADRVAGYVTDFETYSTVLSEGLASKTLSVVRYPSDLYTSVKWHDGSDFSIADVVMNMILTFDRAKQASAIFDPVAVADFEGFMSTFNGLRIVSEDPLVIETYTNALYPDAEITAANSWFPYYDQGQGAWHTLNLGIMAEAAGLGAFSTDKADKNEYTWFNYIAGDTLDMLADQLAAWTESQAIPYEPTLGEFITEAEVQARLENVAAFYDEYEHFWIGTGPLMLDSAFPVAGSLLLTRFEDYPDNAARWLGYSTPQMADLAIDGEARVTIGDEVTFDISVTFEGEPYAIEDVSAVKYLVLDASNNVALEGEAEAVEDGLWQVTLTAEQTAALPVGANSLEVVVVSNLVAVPTSGAFEFVTIE